MRPRYRPQAGTSSAAYQGADPLPSTAARSIWDVFAAVPGAIADGSARSSHSALTVADLDLLAQPGLGVHAFSLAWHRLQPDGRGPIDPTALDGYDRWVDELLRRGVAPWVTLYEHELPLSLMLEGGWLVRDTADRLGDLAAAVADRLADRVRTWLTMHSPSVHSFYGHAIGLDAPGLTLLAQAFDVTHHLLLGHARAAAALRAAGAGRVGVVNHHTPVLPASPAPDDAAAADIYAAVLQDVTRLPLVEGRYPDAALPGTARDVVREGDLAEIAAATLDLYGVAYDGPKVIAAAPGNRAIPFTMVEAPLGAAAPAAHTGLSDRVTELATPRPDLPLALFLLAPPVPAPGADQTDPSAQFASLLAEVDATIEQSPAPVEAVVVGPLLEAWDGAHGYQRPGGLVAVNLSNGTRAPRPTLAAFANWAQAQHGNWR